jgi:hypothetical protein
MRFAGLTMQRNRVTPRARDPLDAPPSRPAMRGATGLGGGVCGARKSSASSPAAGTISVPKPSAGAALLKAFKVSPGNPARSTTNAGPSFDNTEESPTPCAPAPARGVGGGVCVSTAGIIPSPGAATAGSRTITLRGVAGSASEGTSAEGWAADVVRGAVEAGMSDAVGRSSGTGADRPSVTSDDAVSARLVELALAERQDLRGSSGILGRRERRGAAGQTML